MSHMRYWEHARNAMDNGSDFFKLSISTLHRLRKIQKFQHFKTYFILSCVGVGQGGNSKENHYDQRMEKNKLNPCTTSLVAPTWKATALASGRSIFTLRSRGVEVNSCNASQLVRLELK